MSNFFDAQKSDSNSQNTGNSTSGSNFTGKTYSSSRTSRMVKIGLLGAISYIVMNFDMSLPIFPVFMKMDLSDLPPLIGGFALGPVAGIWIEAIKNLLHLFRTSTAGVGEVSNFLTGAGFVFPAAYIYSKNKSRKGAILGLAVGTICTIIVSSLVNYYITIPMYSKVIPLQAILGMAAKINPKVVDMSAYILYVVVPFNFLKSLLISAVTIPLYKRISGFLKRM